MASVNKNASEQAAKPLSDYESLKRSVMACLLWEDNFYEDGESVADRIARYMGNVTPEQAISVLEEAKFDNKLRHVPLYLMVLMAKRGILKADEVSKVITRVDDMTQLLALYQNDSANKHMIPHSIQKGVARAFPKFDEYQLAKYKASNKAMKLRDVIRLAHPKPANTEQSQLWKKVVEGNLATPDTWEVALSKAKDSKEKKDAWVRLLTTKTEDGYNKLGALALLRNLRNIISLNISDAIIKNSIKSMSAKNLLPFQFVTAQRFAPQFSAELEEKFLESARTLKSTTPLKGSTIVLLDVSGSMTDTLSERGSTTRVDVAAGLGAIAREIAEDSIIYKFNTKLELVPSHVKGFSLVDSVREGYGGTSVIECTNNAIDEFRKTHDNKFPDRIIVVTDEQTNSDSDYYGHVLKVTNLPKKSHGYFINVGCYEKGIEYPQSSGWTTISGWSDSVLKYIATVENR